MGSSWPLSRSIVRDESDNPAAGAKAYFYDANTTTPRTTYQDAGLATPHAHPVVADASGRFPRVYLAFGAYAEKVTTAADVQLWHDVEIPNPEPTDPSATVDENALLNTGDIFFSLKNGTRTGAVRLNGRTIGSAASGATERANADTEPLYTFLWNNLADAEAAVATGRGASASADFGANKTITLPDLRASAPLGLDDMGNIAAGRLASVTGASGKTTTPGAVIGENTVALATAQLPSHSHGSGTLAGGSHSHGSGTLAGGSHTHSYNNSNARITVQSGTGEGNIWQGDNTPQTGGTAVGISGSTAGSTVGISGSTAAAGSGTAHNNVQRVGLGTWFIRL